MKHNTTLLQKIKHSWRMFYLKIVKEKASPEYIARGWAIGMFFGCMIPFGFQLMCSIPTAFLLKGSKIGASAGTLLTNPVTIFFIYPVQCLVGNKLIGGSLSLEAIKVALKNVMERQDYESLFNLGGELIASFFVGATILMILMTPLTYFLVKKSVISFRARHSGGRGKKKTANKNKTQKKMQSSAR